MTVSTSLQFGFTDAGGVALSRSLTVASGEQLALDQAIANGQTNQILAFAFVRAKLKAIYIVSDQNITLSTNSGTDTFTLTAGQPLVWYLGCGLAVGAVFTADVTQIRITNASGATATVTIRAIVDPT